MAIHLVGSHITCSGGCVGSRLKAGLDLIEPGCYVNGCLAPVMAARYLCS
jgi:hypothetical protein